MTNESKVQTLGLLVLLATVGCTTAQTTAAPTDPCIGKEDGFLPHPTQCEKYYSCYGGKGYEQVCPDGKYFDPVKIICDISANVNCVPNNCPADGVVFLPIPGVCDRYTICIGGAAFEGVCDDDLYFSAVEEGCTFKNESGCVINPCTQPPPYPPVLEIYPNDGDCHQYLLCFNGEPITRNCSTGLVFDPNTLQCVVGTECIPSDGGATTAAPATTESSSTPATTDGASTDSTSSDPPTTTDPAVTETTTEETTTVDPTTETTSETVV